MAEHRSSGEGDDEELGRFWRDFGRSYVEINSPGRSREPVTIPTWLGVAYSVMVTAFLAAVVFAVVSSAHRFTWIWIAIGLVVVWFLLMVVARVRRR